MQEKLKIVLVAADYAADFVEALKMCHWQVISQAHLSVAIELLLRGQYSVLSTLTFCICFTYTINLTRKLELNQSNLKYLS